MSRLDRAWVLQAPAFLVLGLTLLLALFQGGFTNEAWYAAGLFVLAIAVVALVAAPPLRAGRSRGFDAALGLLGSYVLWSYASILWADAPGTAWEGANRTLLYWLAFGVVGLQRWTPSHIRAALALAVVALTALAVGELLATTRSDPGGLFIEGRLSSPTGYPNATSNLWLIALFPALYLATDRVVPWALRALSMGAATLLLQTALLSQSRGALLAFAVAGVVSILLAPRRWPAIAALLVPVGAVALAFTPLTDVRNARSLPELVDALATARSAIALSAIAAVLVSAAAIGLLRRLLPEGAPAGARRAGDLALAAGLAAVLLGGVVGAATQRGWVDDRWEDFKSGGYVQVEASENRLTGSLGSGRYDYYRVSVNAFKARPLTGLGADNFQVEYLRQRRTDETPRFPHSLVFRTLAMTGVPGALMLFGFLGLGLLLAVRARSPARAGGPAAGAAVGAIAWLAHASVDWLWAFPALTMLALALLAMAMRGDTAPADVGDAAARRWPLGARIAAGVAGAGIFATFAAPGAAARFAADARDYRGTDPGHVLRQLDRAAQLDPLGADALVTKAIFARRIGQPGVAEAALREAARRDPEDWFVHFELGAALTVRGRFREALVELARSRMLNPRQKLLNEAIRLAEQEKRLSADYFESKFVAPLTLKLSPTGR